MPAALLEESAWIQGPSQLKSPNNVVKENYPLVTPDIDAEIRQDVRVASTSIQEVKPLGSERFTRFPNWRKLVRHIGESFGRSDATKSDACRGWHTCKNHKTPEAHIMTEDFIITDVQREFYAQEIDHLKEGKSLPRNSNILSLSPFLDDKGILRIGGRLQRSTLSVNEKNPVLIPGRHHIATLLIRHHHETVEHQGRHFTEGAVRAAGYWINGGKRPISLIVHRCVKCRKLRGKVCQQKMADLPKDRVTISPPFTFVGVDVFGPWDVVTRRTRGGAANHKRQAVLLTCLATRAVHIEVIESISSSSFTNALR